MKSFLKLCGTIGRLFQSDAMDKSMSFLIMDCKEADLEKVQDFITSNNLPVTASYDDNVVAQRRDAKGELYSPSIFVNHNSSGINLDDWV